MNTSQPKWHNLNTHLSAQLRSQLGEPLWQVLTDTGSLTDIVKRDCKGVFAVNVLSQTDAIPDANEARHLQLETNETAIIRDVLLCDSGVPLVFAHSIMPLKTLIGAGEVLGNMGTKPLGAELFSNPRIHRGDIQVTQLNSGHALYPTATSQLESKPTTIWGRRSKFYVGDNPLLVCEFFLPTWRLSQNGDS